MKKNLYPVSRITAALLAIFAVICICSSCGSKKGGSSSKASSSGKKPSSSAFDTAFSSNGESQNASSETVSGQTSSDKQVVSSGQVSEKAESVISSEFPVLAEPLSLSTACVGWGPGKITDHIRSPYAEKNNVRYGKYNAVFIGEDTKNIYLTFDEGYENGYTAPILDTLKEKNVTAVFFVTYDYVKRNPELVSRMINEGHIVGNHSWSHPSLPSLSKEQATDEIMKLHNYVKEQFNYEMKLFRFPKGEFSELTLEICRQCGYKSVFWSFAYVDWDRNKQPDEQAAYQLITGSSHNGALFLLHAVSKTNSNILGMVIDNLREQGYTWTLPKF